MKKYLTYLLFLYFCLTSCSESSTPMPDELVNERTLFMYMPWSSNLTGYFYQNIKDMESCIERMGGLHNERVIVFISKTSTDASLFEIKYEKGKCQRIDIKPYSYPAFTTENGLTNIISDVISYAPAKRYAMIIGCHGMGWLPVKASRTLSSQEKLHWDYPDRPLTRYFGGTTSEFQTDISTLTAAIENTGVKMEYILFDDCYMASIEVAYELKDVTDYLIASTCEVMAYGMPYATMGNHLLGKPNYKAICDDFHEFYSNYSVPCGTLSVTNLSHIEEMANFLKYVNNTYTFDENQRSEIQNLDGYSPTIFYDFGDYINLMLEHNLAPENIRMEFEAKISELVPYKTNTSQFFTATRGPINIYRYSGITTSDPSNSPRAIDKNKTKWYVATH